MNTKITRILALVMCLFTLGVFGVSTFASAYTTYTYSIDGEFLESPDAYTPERVLNYRSFGMEKDFNSPSDIFVDDDGDIYVADAGNNRIVVIDKYYSCKFILEEFTNDQGVPDTFNNPKGVYVKGNRIYVADTNNARIVIFEKQLNRAVFYKVIEEPKSDVFGDNAVYRPIALAADNSGRVYVVSSTTYMGIIAMTEEGAFVGFIGAQKVTYNALEQFWNRFKSADQRQNSVKYLSKEYNNITIDDHGFIYVTISSLDESKQQAAITEKSGDYAPVKKFNSSGADIMKRNGFFAPSGEVDVLNNTVLGNRATGPSKIVDVALGPEGTWSIADANRMKLFTYDDNGNLLYAFGDLGNQLGTLTDVTGIAYSGSALLVMDAPKRNITVYQRTEYGDILIQAIKDNNDRLYDNAVNNWQRILQRNNNFDVAYVGIGKAYYRSGEYELAMEKYQAAYDTENYSNAFKMMRKQVVKDYLPLILVIAAALITGVVFFARFAKKVNDRVAVSGKKRTFGQEILYAFHLIFHPFDGFWDLKREKRGSVRGALFYIALTILAFTYNAVGKAYVFNPRGGDSTSVLIQITAVIVPLLLFITANWCFTTLFDGEGSFKDIFIASSYSLAPLPLLMIPATALTHALSASETGLVSLLVTIAWIWVGLLLFFGTLVTHDYSLGKNILITIATIVGMVFIMFIAVLFSTLLTKMISFVSQIITEISYRM